MVSAAVYTQSSGNRSGCIITNVDESRVIYYTVTRLDPSMSFKQRIRSVTEHLLGIAVDIGVSIEQIEVQRPTIISDIVQKYYPSESIIIHSIKPDSVSSEIISGFVDRDVRKDYAPTQKYPSSVILRTDMSYKSQSLCYGLCVVDKSQMYYAKSKYMPTVNPNSKEHFEHSAAVWGLLQLAETSISNITLQIDNEDVPTLLDTAQFTQDITVSVIDRGQNKIADILARSGIHTQTDISF